VQGVGARSKERGAVKSCPNCAKLKKKIKHLKTVNQQLTQDNTQLREEVKELKRQLAPYENAKILANPKTKTKTKTDIKKHAHPARHNPNGLRFPGRPKGHPGRTRPQPRPDEIRRPEWGECKHCGAALPGPEFVEHHIVEEISNPTPKTCIDFLEYQGACDVCGQYTISRHPDCPPDGRLGKNVLVQTTLMRYEDRLTLRKVVEALARQHGLILSPATILDITRRVSFWLEPVYEGIWEKIGKAPVVYVDETGEKVDGVNYWLWTFVTLTETLLVIRKRRSKNVLKEVLGEEFDGWIGCDGWKSYPAFTTNIQRDWAHLLREARELAQEYREAEPLYRGLKRIFDRVEKALKTDPPPQERERLARNARSAMRRWIKRPYKKRKVKSLAKKMDNGFAYWFSYITHPGIEPTNNMAEQSLREPVVQRKIMGCFRNHKGTHIYEVITSVLATWKKRGYNTSQMLAQTLTQQWARS